MKHIDLDIEIDFMDVSSYDGAESVGDVKINKDLDKSVKGESILLVEDIVDTGRTLKEVKKLLLHKGAAEVKIVSLLDKPSRRVIEIQADYVGFEIPNEFVVGYGLDYDQKYRNLPYIGGAEATGVRKQITTAAQRRFEENEKMDELPALRIGDHNPGLTDHLQQ